MGENTGQNSGNKHIRGDDRDSRQQKKSGQGERKGEKATNQPQSTLEVAWFIPGPLPSFLAQRLSAPHKQLVFTQLQHLSMLLFYSLCSIPLRSWIPLFYTVQLGSIHTDQPRQSVTHRVFKIIIHPQSENTSADIALLKLVSRVTFTPFILPICLPSVTKQLKIPASCWVTGWGKVKEREGENGYRKGWFYPSSSSYTFQNMCILGIPLLWQIFFNKPQPIDIIYKFSNVFFHSQYVYLLSYPAQSLAIAARADTNNLNT